MYCVDLGESFQTHMFLQNFASIQPRTSPLKLAGWSGAEFVEDLRVGEHGELRGQGHHAAGAGLRGFLLGRLAGVSAGWLGRASIRFLRFRGSGAGRPMFFLTVLLTLGQFWQTFRGPFSAVSTPIFYRTSEVRKTKENLQEDTEE